MVNKMGRPPLRPGKKKGASVGFRMRPKMQKALMRSARENGTSLSHEIEMRLERSLTLPDPIDMGERYLSADLLTMLEVLIEHYEGGYAYTEWWDKAKRMVKQARAT